MLRIKIVFLFLFTLGFFKSETPKNSIGTDYVSDFNILVTSLKELQPMLYKNISKEEFDKQVKIVSERLSATKDRFKAIYIIQEFFYKLGNSHAGNISVYGDLGITKSLPFSVYIVNRELYIKEYPADSSFNGVKIQSIEGTPAHELIDSLRIFFLRDGIRDIMDPNLQPYFNSLYGRFCCQKDTFHVLSESGNLKCIAAIRGTPLFDKLVLNNGEAYFGKVKDRILTKEVNNNYGYFKFINFHPEIRKINIKDAFVSFIKEVNQKKVQNIVIDLRGNNGGEADFAEFMATYLADHPFKVFTNSYYTLCKKPTYFELTQNKTYFRARGIRTNREDSLRKIVRFDRDLKLFQPKKDGFKGHIYILTSGFTQSAATVFCGYLIDQSNVTFIGAETAGATNYLWAGNFFEAQLPNLNSKYEFGVELIEMKEGSVKNELPSGLVPDIKIEYSIDDLVNKKDKEMDWIINHLAKGN